MNTTNLADKQTRVRDQVRNANKARLTAFNRLKAAHQDEYRLYYEEEAAKLGVKTHSQSKERKKAKLIAELRALGVEVPE